MISETLATGLAEYRIGPKVRSLRKRKGLSLVQLGSHSGLSPGLLSKIERGQLVPTLPTLLRIALVFGVGLEHFFVEASAGPMLAVVRKADRLRLPDRADASAPSYFFESLDFPATGRRMEAYLAEFPPGAKRSEPHRHEGAEFIFVLRGRLGLEVGETEIRLDEGDSTYFESGAPHSYWSEGRSGCSVIVVVAA